MFNIRKYTDCWALHDDDTGASRKLSAEEVEIVKEEFPGLDDEKVLSIYTDTIYSINTSSLEQTKPSN